MKTNGISVIIPVYNVEEYLPKCLDSIEKQTDKEFELILVDDGSTDNSGCLCDEYQKKHENVLVIHQENQGLSAARNNGVKISNCEYITFIDSDDYVSPRYVEYLKYLKSMSDAEICIGQYINVWEDYNSFGAYKNLNLKLMDTEEAVSKLLYEKGFSSIAVGKLYKKSLLIQYPYPLGILYEDMATTYRLVGDSKKVALGEEIIYFWRRHNNTITKSKLTDKHLYAIKICEDIMEYVSKKFPSAISAARSKYMAKICMFMPAVISDKENGKSIFIKLKKMARPYIDSVIKDKNARKDIRIRCLSFKLGIIPSYLIAKVTESVKPLKSKILIRKLGIK